MWSVRLSSSIRGGWGEGRRAFYGWFLLLFPYRSLGKEGVEPCVIALPLPVACLI